MTTDISTLTYDQRVLLDWLNKSAHGYSQYGECSGRALDFLQMKKLVKVWPGVEHQEGFIAQRDHPSYRAVSLTDEGKALAQALKGEKEYDYR